MTKEDKVELFIKLFGYKEAFENQRNFVLERLKQTITEGEMETLKTVFDEIDLDKPEREVVRIISELYSEEELDQAIEFFQSNFGKVYLKRKKEFEDRMQDFTIEWQKEMQKSLMSKLFQRAIVDKMSRMGLGTPKLDN